MPNDPSVNTLIREELNSAGENKFNRFKTEVGTINIKNKFDQRKVLPSSIV
jgi:hypothetical protein